MSDEVKFLNAPIKLIQGIFQNKTKCLENILNYSIYAHSLKFDGEGYYNNADYNRFFAAAKCYINIASVTEARFKDAKKLYNSIPEKSPKVGLNISIFWDYFKNEKSEYDIACLAAFLAIKSIIGLKTYAKTTNEFLIARMGGYSSNSDVPEPLLKPLAIYTTRRRLDRIKQDLQLNWNVNIYSSKVIRGFYVSIDQKYSLDQLALVAENNLLVNTKKLLKEQIEQARNKALQQLNN